MSAGRRYRGILSVLLSAGALGMSILLGSTGAEAARELPAGSPDAASVPVGERLAAIRDAVSEVARSDGTVPLLERSEQLAWGNFGFSIPLPFPFWNNWGNGWSNWGNNWHNGWHNWGNNWHNGWRNH